MAHTYASSTISPLCVTGFLRLCSPFPHSLLHFSTEQFIKLSFSSSILACKFRILRIHLTLAVLRNAWLGNIVWVITQRSSVRKKITRKTLANCFFLGFFFRRGAHPFLISEGCGCRSTKGCAVSRWKSLSKICLCILGLMSSPSSSCARERSVCLHLLGTFSREKMDKVFIFIAPRVAALF